MSEPTTLEKIALMLAALDNLEICESHACEMAWIAAAWLNSALPVLEAARETYIEADRQEDSSAALCEQIHSMLATDAIDSIIAPLWAAFTKEATNEAT